jgi:hypothetical protein
MNEPISPFELSNVQFLALRDLLVDVWQNLQPEAQDGRLLEVQIRFNSPGLNKRWEGITPLERSQFSHMYNIFEAEKWENLGALFSAFRENPNEFLQKDFEFVDNLMDSFKRPEREPIAQSWLVPGSVSKIVTQTVRIMSEKKQNERVTQLTPPEIAKAIREDLVKYRAIGTANATSEFNAYIKRLKIIDEKDWNFEKLAEHLRKPFIFSDLKNGFSNFLHVTFTAIDHPMITFLAGGATFKFTTLENKQYIFKLQVGGYQQYSLILLSQLSPKTSAKRGRHRRKSRSGNDLIISRVQYASPYGLKNVLEEYWNGTGFKLKSVVFTRPGFRYDFTDSIAYLYRNPTMKELIPLYFANWQFFTEGSTCDRCSKDLTHPISVIKGTGPICGHHDYKLGDLDTSRVQTYIERVRKNRIFLRDSPLIKSRTSAYFSLEPKSRANLLSKLRSEHELSQSETSTMIYQMIMKTYVYPRRRRTGMPMGRNGRHRR